MESGAWYPSGSWRGGGAMATGSQVQEFKVWSLRRNPEVIVLPEIDLSSLPYTQQSNFTLISQQCFTIPTKALFLTAYKTMALREDWRLSLPWAIKYDGLLSDSEEEGDAFPCCPLQPDCRLLTAVTSERGLASQMLWCALSRRTGLLINSSIVFLFWSGGSCFLLFFIISVSLLGRLLCRDGYVLKKLEDTSFSNFSSSTPALCSQLEGGCRTKIKMTGFKNRASPKKKKKKKWSFPKNESSEPNNSYMYK